MAFEFECKAFSLTLLCESVAARLAGCENSTFARLHSTAKASVSNVSSAFKIGMRLIVITPIRIIIRCTKCFQY